MTQWLGTTNAVAAKLGISPQRVRQLINELGIEAQWVGKSMILDTEDIKKLEKRKTQRGPERRRTTKQ